MIKYIIAGALILVGIIAGILLPQSIQVPVQQIVGGSSGTLHTQPEYFAAGFAGRINSTSTNSYATAITMKESDLVAYSDIEITPGGPAQTWTFPASSSVSMMPSAGDSRTWIFTNLSTTAASTTAFAAGTGWNFSGTTSTPQTLVGAAYTARQVLKVDCFRQVNKDINCMFQKFIASD